MQEPSLPICPQLRTPQAVLSVHEYARRVPRSKEIKFAEESDQLTKAGSLFSAKEKPVEELYDLHRDPHEINNLAQDPKYRKKIDEMRQALAQWQREIGDIGLVPEAEISIAER